VTTPFSSIVHWPPSSKVSADVFGDARVDAVGPQVERRADARAVGAGKFARVDAGGLLHGREILSLNLDRSNLGRSARRRRIATRETEGGGRAEGGDGDSGGVLHM